MILTEYDAKKHIAAEKSESYREGEAAGEARGEAAGEARFATLSLRLIGDGKTGDLERAARDVQLRQELYRQYGI